MAESVFTQMIGKFGWTGKVFADSAAAHTDEIGNPPHRGTREKLAAEGVPLVPHRARLMTRADGEKYDLLIGMDEYNIRDMRAIVGGRNAEKVRLLLSFAGSSRAIADPWYTHNFDETYRDSVEGCEGLVRYLAARYALPAAD